MEPLIHPEHVQRDFLKYSAQKIKHDLKKMHPAVLSRFKARVSVSTNPFNDVSSGAWGHAPRRGEEKHPPRRKNTNIHQHYFITQA